MLNESILKEAYLTSRFPGYALLAATMLVMIPFPASAAPKAAQLVDVSPNHWSYPAIKSLMEKYKVMAGYPDMTFRGTKPVSRYELAAALAAIIEKLDRPSVDEGKLLDFDKKTIEKLRAEFKSELAANTGSGDVNKRVTAVEADFKTLQKNFDSMSKVKGSVSTTFMDQMNNKYFPYLASDISLKFAGSFSDKITYETKLGGGLAASQTGNTPAIANGDKPPESTAKFDSAKMTYSDKNLNNLKVVIGRCNPTGFGLGGFAGHTGDGIIGSGLTGFGGNTVRDGGDINISSSLGLGPLKVATALTSKAVLGNVSLEAGPLDFRFQGDVDHYEVGDPKGGVSERNYNFAGGLNLGTDQLGLFVQAGLKKDVPRAGGGFVFNLGGVETALGASYKTDAKQTTTQVQPGGYVYFPSFGGLPTLLIGFTEPQTLSSKGGQSGPGSLMGDMAGLTVQTYIDNPLIPNLTMEFNLQDKILTYDDKTSLVGYAVTTSFEF
ncbi:MAG TPA: hypothetical protein DD435_09425 [Cyanobacteria bacterium UBA8530]|nr:hypothetical protein [Cyanobacteria bacterium UBA8530]